MIQMCSRSMPHRSVILLATLFLFSSALLSSAQSSAADPAANIRFITENSPPYNYVDDGKLVGSSVDLLIEVFRLIGSFKARGDIELHPWARGYHIVQEEPGTVLFSTRRSPERESLFRWVGPVAISPVVLMARKKRDFEVHDLADLNRLSIVAVGSDMGEIMLNTHHIPDNIRQTVSYPDIAARMLIFNRIDLWSYGQRTALWLIKQQGGQPSEYEPVWSFGSAGGLYLAFHRDTPDSTIELFQSALDQLKTDQPEGGLSTYDRILNSYIE